MRKLHLVSAAAVAALATIAPVSVASAAPKSLIQLDGPGSFTFAADGSAVITGQATGKPLDGPFTAVLAADDGTLPEPGACEPGSVRFTMVGPRPKRLEVTSTSEVCGEFVQLPIVVTHSFDGRYDVVDARPRKLNGTDGFIDVVLANDGRAHVFLIDT